MLIRIKSLSNRTILELMTPCDNRWEIIQDTIAGDFECDPDDVHALQTEDGDELITAAGVPVARVERKSGWDALGVG